MVSEGEASLQSLVTYPRVRLWGYGALEEVWVLVGGRARVSIRGVRPPVAFFCPIGVRVGPSPFARDGGDC